MKTDPGQPPAHPSGAIEIVWRHDPEAGVVERQPRTALDARTRLDEGSATFAELTARGGRHVVDLPADALGLPAKPGGAVAQEPFAAVLGCADARVPVELLFGQAANDLFVVRVAGNVPGVECLGSLDYAVTHLGSLRLLAVVGHTGCGAVSAAVDTALEPDAYFGVAGNPDLRSVVDAIGPAVTAAARAIADVRGPEAASDPQYREALILTAVVVNAALTASLVRTEASSWPADDVGVAFGVYDLASRSVGLPAAAGWQSGLVDPPDSAAALGELARRTAAAALPA